MACSKNTGRICTFLVFCMCFLTVEIDVAFSLLPPEKSLEKGGLKNKSKTKSNLKTQTTLLEFCSETQNKIYFPLSWTENWKITASWRLAQQARLILTPALLATPSVVLAAKCEASLEHEEIRPGRQLQFLTSVLGKAFQSLASVFWCTPSSGHACAGFCSTETKGKQGTCHSPFLSSREKKILWEAKREAAVTLSKLQKECYFFFTSRNFIFCFCSNCVVCYLI